MLFNLSRALTLALLSTSLSHVAGTPLPAKLDAVGVASQDDNPQRRGLRAADALRLYAFAVLPRAEVHSQPEQAPAGKRSAGQLSVGKPSAGKAPAAANPAAKPAAKPVARPAPKAIDTPVKPVTKPVTKPVVKSAPVPNPVKPVNKPVVKPAPKPVTDPKKADGKSCKRANSYVDRSCEILNEANRQKARARGRKLMEDLDKAIANNTPDKRPVADLSTLSTARYSVSQTTRKLLGDEDSDSGADNLGGSHPIWLENNFPSIDLTANWQVTTIRSTAKVQDPILETTAECVKCGTMIINQSWSKISDVATEGEKVLWSDMTMMSWRKAAEKDQGDVKTLKWIARDNVVSARTDTSDGIALNTHVVMNEICEEFGTGETKVLEIQNQDPQSKAAVEFLAAQTHVARVYSMLKDHHQELGNLKPVRIHLFLDGYKGDLNSHIMIELERAGGSK